MGEAKRILPTETLRESYPKLNAAIDNSNEALTKSTTAESNSATAVNTANTAEIKADSVQAQFNQVVIEGDSSVEAAQARVNADGTTFTTLRDRLNNTDVQMSQISVNVKSHGAAGDGVTIDTLAFKSAITAAQTAGKKVLVPAGDYIIDDTLTADSIIFEGHGTQSRLIFTNMNGKDGIVFTPTSKEKTAGAFNLSILCKDSNGGSAIKTPQSSLQYSTYRSKYQFEYLQFGGYTKPLDNLTFETVESWAYCFDLGDAFNIGIRECDGYGNYRIDTAPATQFKSVFIRTQAANTGLTCHMSSCTISCFYQGIEIGEKTFFDYEQIDITHCYDGIYQTATTSPYNESRITNVNINAQRYGVYMQGVQSRRLSGVIIRRHRYGDKTATHNFYGIYMDSCSGVWLDDVHVQPDESSGAFGGEARGISLVNCGATSIIGYHAGSTLEEGIRLDNCTGIVIDNTMTWQSQSGAYLFRLINNTRSSSIGKYSLVSSFAGTVFSNDSTIGGSIFFVQKDLSLDSNQPLIRMTENDGGVDTKIWKTAINGGSCNRQVSNDNETTNINYELVTRTGTTVDQIEWRATSFYLNGNETKTKKTRPVTDNAYSLGDGIYRYSQLYAGTGTINTSDRNAKTEIGSIPDVVLDAWAEVNYSRFKFKDAYEQKGDLARWHVGVIAQEIEDAFHRHGLNAFEFGLLCYNEWEDQYDIDQEGNQVLVIPAGSRYSIRPDECLMLEAALMRREIQRIKAQ